MFRILRNKPKDQGVVRALNPAPKSKSNTHIVCKTISAGELAQTFQIECESLTTESVQNESIKARVSECELETSSLIGNY